MDLYILDKDFQIKKVIDTYKSLIWVDRFAEPGSFELVTPLTSEILTYVKPGNYISSDFSEHTMIIEDISIEADTEDGDMFKAVGRSLESILDRRIVWTQTDFNNANLNTVTDTLLNDAIVAPTVMDRRISNFSAYVASEDPYISAQVVNHQYTGDNLLDVIESLCAEFDIGYQILLDENNQFVFSLYSGDDRSYVQNVNPPVVFSPDFDNVISSNYINKTSILKNIVLVGGEGTGTSRKFKVVGAQKGLDRRETFTNASDIQKGSLSNAKYMALLEKRGVSVLDETNHRVDFDSKCDTTQMYVYGEHFFLGDYVEVANAYGVESAARVTEFTVSVSTSGIETYPTFSVIERSITTGKNKMATTLANLKTLNTSGEWSGNVWVNNNVILTVNTDRFDRVTGITFSGKNSSSSNINFILGQIMLSEEDEANNLVLSGCINGSSSTYRITQYDKTSNADRAINYDGDTTITVLDKTHVYQGRLTFYRNKDFVDVTVYPMVRSITENDEFEPYDPNFTQ